jgi:putative flippase GtrA
MSTFIRYLISGGFATIVHYLSLIFLVQVAGINPIISTSIGFILAIFVNYPLQYYWVFEVDARHRKVFYKYILVTFFTFFVNLVVFWLLFSVFQYWYLISQAVSTVVVILLNYTINKKITFQN